MFKDMWNFVIGQPKVFHVYATERSGHHSVMFWLGHQFKNIKHHGDYCKSEKHAFIQYKKHKIVKIDNDNYVYDPIPPKTNVVLYNYETNPIIKNHDNNIIVLRDFKNTFASFMNNSKTKKSVPFHESRAKTWKSRAKAILDGQGYFINYNKYNCDKEYRLQICKDLKLKFTDIGIDYYLPFNVESSFIKKDNICNFDYTQLNKRYLKFKDQKRFKYYMAIYNDCLQMSNKIFGDV